MKPIFELEYRGLNILDEISTVEIAIDVCKNVIHIFDMNQVVEPEFNFSAKKYQMSDGFYKMAKVLYEKQFFEVQSEEQWINHITWVFYGLKKSILKSNGLNITEVPKMASLLEMQNKELHLYNKYLLRVL